MYVLSALLVVPSSHYLKFQVPGSCGKLPTDIGNPAGGSLTSDQWLLLATLYGPIVVGIIWTLSFIPSLSRCTQIPQLWNTCLPHDGATEIIRGHVRVIERLEANKKAELTRKAENKKALAEAKKQGREVFEAVRAQIDQENLKIAEEKQQKKLCEKAEKAKLVAAKKAKAAALKVSPTFIWLLSWHFITSL